MNRIHALVRGRQSRPAAGFTLIELMVVIVILGILAGIVAPRLIGRTDDAKISKARADIESLSTAVKLYRLDTGKYPTMEQGLDVLVTPPEGDSSGKWREGGYLEDRKTVPKDPWGYDYVYIYPGSQGDFDLSSYGEDGQPGGEGAAGDINSWDES